MLGGIALASETLTSQCPHLTESHHIRHSPQEALDTEDVTSDPEEHRASFLLCNGSGTSRHGRRAPGPMGHIWPAL